MKSISEDEPCPVCGRYNNRGISIDAVILRGSKILLIRRGAEPFKGKWALPGGYIEWDESAPGATAREVAEESGLKVTDTHLVGVYSKPDRHPNQVITIVYLVKASGEPTAGDDAADSKFVPLNELPGDLAFDHAQIIKDALKLI